MLMAVKSDLETQLNETLVDWYRWAKGYNFSGYSSVCKQFKDTPSPRQWESTADLADESQHKSTMKAVQFAVDSLTDVHRTAINLLARNLSTGSSVWQSARLPLDPIARSGIVMDAKMALRRKLITAGVL